jgi:ATP-dependent DNA helicase DinG
VPNPRDLIEQAFERLESRAGFQRRQDQTQLALLLSDLIEHRATGIFEAPTGLGKSLAALIPAIAHGIAGSKRTVIATYTNVLAEQYWKKDLPLALSLFDDAPECGFLIGRQRYVCRIEVDEHVPQLDRAIRVCAPTGIESEVRAAFATTRDFNQTWPKIAVPPACPSRACPAYDDCTYYGARRKAEMAKVLLTNHSVVIQHAVMKEAAPDMEGLLGDYDFLIVDEAHDFPQAAVNGLEFEVSPVKLSAIGALSARFERLVAPAAVGTPGQARWTQSAQAFRDGLDGLAGRISHSVARPGIVSVAPPDLQTHPQVSQASAGEGSPARDWAHEAGLLCRDFVAAAESILTEAKGTNPDTARPLSEAAQSYIGFVREFAIGAERMFETAGVSVAYLGESARIPMVRKDIVHLAPVLQQLLWAKGPAAFLSATLAVDGAFDYFKGETGAKAEFEDLLPTPFDFATQATLYMPPAGRIPDPTVARREGGEEAYWQAVARELADIIVSMNGRTLALFHSRKEMEAVYERLTVPDHLPIFGQSRTGASNVGDKFRAKIESTLFGLRSFWTGFDAPGETLSCVVLVRVPFEVPVDPLSIARLAWLQSQGRDAFREHTLPQAKMMMRQGAGRLIRRSDDRGVIALLDPRIRTKRYGEEILGNLPPELRHFDDFLEAMAAVGLE